MIRKGYSFNRVYMRVVYTPETMTYTWLEAILLVAVAYVRHFPWAISREPLTPKQKSTLGRHVFLLQIVCSSSQDPKVECMSNGLPHANSSCTYQIYSVKRMLNFVPLPTTIVKEPVIYFLFRFILLGRQITSFSCLSLWPSIFYQWWTNLYLLIDDVILLWISATGQEYSTYYDCHWKFILCLLIYTKLY